MNFLWRTILAKPGQLQGSLIHTSAAVNKNWFQNSDDGAAKWLRHNKTMFPPEENLVRPAVSTIIAPSDPRIFNFIKYDPCPFPVRLPCQDQHQVQSEEAVVRGLVGPRHDRR